MMKAASYLLSDKVAKRHHPVNKGVPRGILPSVGIGLNP
jgi:hypothetical protein